MKKSWIFAVWLTVTVILVLLVFEPVKKPKEVEAEKQPAQTIIRSQKDSNLWLPEDGKMVFLNRPIFLEGEIKERLLRELEVEVKRYKSGGLDYIKNDIWLSYVGKQLEKADLPSDLIYLPIIESSMKATIVSSKGAGGYWQFMPGTASPYGLIMNQYIDERFDPVKSTDAAIRHLNDLVDIFDDWTASLGGYNMDPAALKEAMKQERTRNFYRLKNIPLETQRFLFRLLATKLIFENPEKYGFSRTGWLPASTHNNWKILEIDLIVGTDSSIDGIVNEIRKNETTYSNLTVDELKRFNPHILGNFLPRGNYTMYILRTRNGAS